MEGLIFLRRGRLIWRTGFSCGCSGCFFGRTDGLTIATVLRETQLGILVAKASFEVHAQVLCHLWAGQGPCLLHSSVSLSSWVWLARELSKFVVVVVVVVEVGLSRLQRIGGKVAKNFCRLFVLPDGFAF